MNNISSDLVYVLQNYRHTITNPKYKYESRDAYKIDREAPVVKRLTDVRNNLVDIVQSKSFSNIIVEPGYGAGSWAKIPWIAFFDKRHTAIAQKWFYPVILFKNDGSGLYLSLSVAVGNYTKPTKNNAIPRIGKNKLEPLENVAKNLRGYFIGFEKLGFQYENNLEFGVEENHKMAEGYSKGSIFNKFYSINDFPSDKDFIGDVITVLRSYDEFCSKNNASNIFDDPNSYSDEIPEKEKQISIHEQYQDMLIDIGKVFGKITYKEYTEKPYRYDVTWHDPVRKGMSDVFEVQYHGDVTTALAKLKHARDTWKSNLFFIYAEEKDLKKVKERLAPVLQGTFHEIEKHLNIISGLELEDLHRVVTSNADSIKTWLSN